MIIRLLKLIKIEKLMGLMQPIGSWYLRVSPRMITCREFNDFIFDYTEGTLTERQLTLFERHIKVCPICRQFLQTYVATFNTGKMFFPYNDRKVPDTVPEDLLIAIQDVKNQTK